MTPTATLDARDLLCPLPVLKARKRLLSMKPGEVLEVQATDPMAQIDLPHFCAETGHEHLSCHEDNGVQTHLIRCGPARD